MVGRVGQEIRLRLTEERVLAAVAFGQNDLVEQHYRWIVHGLPLTFVDKFVEG